jgi:hypothetical protein
VYDLAGRVKPSLGAGSRPARRESGLEHALSGPGQEVARFGQQRRIDGRFEPLAASPHARAAAFGKEVTTMRNSARTVLAFAALICLLPAAGQAALATYSQNFESLVQSDINALSNDGWLVYGNVFNPAGTIRLYGYGAFPAPNTGAAFCAIDAGQGGDEQGSQQLSVYSDYNNTDHAKGYRIESNVFHEQTIGPGDVGNTWRFDFQAKRGTLGFTSTAQAFIKTLNPSAGYALTNLISVDMTAIPTTWASYSLSIAIDPSLSGQILQFGFLSNATFYEDSGIFYDNLSFHFQAATAVPPDATALGVELRQNYPNPFNPSTQIEFALERPEAVEITVFDLAGRRVATLQRGELGAGEHHVTWNGRTDRGATVPTGQYRYVLKTGSGQLSRSMVLVK